MSVRNTRSPSSISVVAGIALAGFAPSAYAYLDPSTGSMILSAILGIMATVGLALKTYWYKFKSLFRGKPVQPPVKAQSDDAASGAGGSAGH